MNEITARNSKLSSQLIDLLQSVNHTLEIEKGCFLFQEGTEANELFILNSGRIQVSKVSADGRELTFRLCGPGDIIGELTLFSEGAKHLLNARALEDGEVSVINKDELEAKLLENSVLAFEFMKWMSEHFRRTQTKLRDLVLHGKKGALYSTLVRMSNSYGYEKKDGILIDLPFTNQELANFAGTARESVNRMLGDLRKKGIISVNKGKITIHDLQYIKDEINCEDCPADLCNID
ncbi:Crp/Fnr family transcriptional regulator [Bacillus marinisedimentorum]|uniref:Crp/Fnr family transcriptional regulator n=1 Tax=Bacillus marinisedimentorum TaxID=1821260 RepID=UPI000872B830|nr:Crp/Fnr family transcriptional regulator [Bacillus marinisedimentorum]